MDLALLNTSHDPWVVALSYLIASFASFVALDLAKRVRHPDRALARVWWAAGSLTMGTGIWAMHFVGMLALSLPIAVGYRSSVTALSWVAGVAVSAIALYVASRAQLTARRLAVGAATMGLGICAMHYTGMAALDLAPGVQWRPWLVAASAAVAVGASAAALLMFFGLRRLSGRKAAYGQHLAALVMGAAISGMHYTGMAAAAFPEGTVCLSVDQLSGQRLVLLVSLAAGALLTLTFLISLLDTRLQRRNDALTQSLQSAHTELHDQALRDPLTGLPNMQIFRDRLDAAVERCVRGAGGGAAVLYLNLDGFKPLNEAFGHAFGDQLLRQVGQRLAAELSGTGFTARLAGDEFLVLLEGPLDHAVLGLTAQRLVTACAAPLGVGGEDVRITCSVGIAVYPDNGPQAELLAHANAAMETAKRKGGAGYAFFAKHMNADVRDQIALKRDLRTAIADGQLELHYQPKLSAASGQITGVEALLRWRHPTRGLVSPAVFIPVAERFGLIGALGDWVVNQACAQLRAWLDAGHTLRVAVNLSVHQLRQEDLDGRVRQALTWHRVDPDLLTMEITETAAMEDAGTTAVTIERLRRMGVHLSIDDFGTGYSSLSYLRRLKAQELKIDRSFVVDLADSVDARAVVQGVINLAHALGLKVVAEGVETREQQAILAAQHCDELQGFLFARPMPAKDLTAWLTTQGAGRHAAQVSLA